MKTMPPIHILIAFLVLLSLAAIFTTSGLDAKLWAEHFERWAAIFLAGYLVFRILQSIFPVAPSRLEHRLITSLILFLLFDPTQPWWFFFVLGAVAEVFERTLRTASGPLFNPAALGAFLLSLAGHYPGWWGVNFPPSLPVPIIGSDMSAAMLLTVPLAGYVLYRYRKQSIVFAFIVTFLLSHFLLSGTWPLFLLLEGTLAFFLLVMVVEPKTSPNIRMDQYVYGAIIGIGIPLFMRLGWFDAMLGTLLIANLYTARAFLASRWFLLYGKRKMAS